MIDVNVWRTISHFVCWLQVTCFGCLSMTFYRSTVKYWRLWAVQYVNHWDKLLFSVDSKQFCRIIILINQFNWCSLRRLVEITTPLECISFSLSMLVEFNLIMWLCAYRTFHIASHTMKCSHSKVIETLSRKSIKPIILAS